MKVYVYALTDVHYYAFYIQGLYETIGRENVFFNIDKFPDFGIKCCALIVESKLGFKKIIIDAYDSPNVNNKYFEWCDIYAKSNISLSRSYHKKVFNIGPSFGVQIWGLLGTAKYAVSNFLKGKKSIRNKREYFASYWRQYKRLKYKKYIREEKIKENYVYFISSIWNKEQRTNRARFQFIEFCKKSALIDFEGGFAPRSDNNNLGYDGVISKRIPLSRYISNIKKSVFVFNTPAVQDCHGWKLAEFLCMGKAIISTPGFNVLPNVKDQNIVCYLSVFDEFEIKTKKILENPEYRKLLEKNAKLYWENTLKPSVVLHKILEFKV